MTYVIADQTITFSGDSLSPDEQRLIKAHPDLFKYCLNSTAHRYLLSMKRIVHLYTDVVTIYGALLLKIPNYDDITAMTNRTKANLSRLEDTMNTVFGRGLDVLNEGWENKNYETQVKQIALLVLRSCLGSFDLVYKTLSCIDVFFDSFDNLKKLLVPCLLAHTRMVQKSITGAMNFFRLSTIVNDIGQLLELTPAAVRQLAKIDTITSGIEREAKLLDLVFSAVDPSLRQYTNILLGKAILKRNISDADCQIISRRDVCFHAVEHVVSIPLSGSSSTRSYVQQFTKHLFYFFSAILVVVLAVLFRLYKVIFG